MCAVSGPLTASACVAVNGSYQLSVFPSHSALPTLCTQQVRHELISRPLLLQRSRRPCLVSSNGYFITPRVQTSPHHSPDSLSVFTQVCALHTSGLCAHRESRIPIWSPGQGEKANDSTYQVLLPSQRCVYLKQVFQEKAANT